MSCSGGSRPYFWSCMTYRTMMDYVLDSAPSSNVQALLQTRDSGADGNKLHFLDAVWRLLPGSEPDRPMAQSWCWTGPPACQGQGGDLQSAAAAGGKVGCLQPGNFMGSDTSVLQPGGAGRVVYDCGSLIKKIEGIRR